MFKNKNFIIFLAVFEAFIFVVMSALIRYMNESFNLPQQLFLRLFGAFLFASLVFYPSIKKIKFLEISKKDWLIYISRSLIYYGLGVTLITYALTHATIALVSFASSLPVMGVFAFIYFRERINIKALPFILISVIGLGMLSKINIANINFNNGLIAAVLSLVAFDTAYLMVRLHNPKYTNKVNTFFMLMFSWIPAFIYLLVKTEPILPKNISLISLTAIILSIILNVINVIIINYIFTKLKAYVAGNLLLLEGVFALIIGAILFNETINLYQFIGATIIIISAIAAGYLEDKTI